MRCQQCSVTNKPLEDHHIVEVNGTHLRYSNGCFNCIRLCKHCHDKIIHTKENDHKMLTLAANHWSMLIATGKYNPTNIDNKCFIELTELYATKN